MELVNILHEWHFHPTAHGKGACDKETEIVLSSKDDHEETLKTLKSRIDAAVTINGTAQYHAFIPIGDGRLKLKKFSASTQCDFFPKPKKD